MIIDKLTELGIDLKNRTRGQWKTVCPKCSEDRKHKLEPCLSVNIDEGLYSCHNCGWKGRVYEKFDKTYVLPQKNNTSLSDKTLAWFKNRGINQGTLKAWDVTEHTDHGRNWINFNYYRNGEVVNAKYRDSEKNFRMAKGAELIFYGLDKIIGNDTCVITEGEIDSLSYYEANVLSVCSVPNGASKGNQKLEYLDNCIVEFKDFKTIFIAVDNDEPGLALRSELARRLGKHRCKWIDFGDCKDANEYLVKYGAGLLKQTIERNAKTFPVEGVIRVTDFADKIDSIYNNGFPKGVTVGHWNMDEHIRYIGGQWTLVVGLPYSGKSEVVDQIMVSLAYRYGWKFGLFSSENMPYEYHFTKIAEKFVGKKWSDFTKGDIGRSKEWINEHFYWISIEANVLSLEFLLEKYAELVVSHGLKGFVLDPWNQIEHMIPKGMNETQYVSKALSMVTTFVQRYDSHLWIVTHPTKPLKAKDGKVIRPKLSDAAGSMNFANKAYNGFVVYRDFEFNTVEVEVAKVKFKFLGKHGIVPVQWNGDRGGQYWPLVPLEQKQVMIDEKPPF